MLEPLYFEDLEIGSNWLSPTRRVSERDVRDFATLTGDHHPLHRDEVFARNSPFGRPIAHGLLGLSFVAGLSSESPLLSIEAFLGVHDWRFLKPVYFGDRVHVLSEVGDLKSYGRKRGRLFMKRVLVNQDGQAVQAGTFELLVSRRKLAARRSRVAELAQT